MDVEREVISYKILNPFYSSFLQLPLQAAGAKIERGEKKRARKGMGPPLFSPSPSFRRLSRRLLASYYYNKLHHTR